MWSKCHKMQKTQNKCRWSGARLEMWLSLGNYCDPESVETKREPKKTADEDGERTRDRSLWSQDFFQELDSALHWSTNVSIQTEEDLCWTVFMVGDKLPQFEQEQDRNDCSWSVRDVRWSWLCDWTVIYVPSGVILDFKFDKPIISVIKTLFPSLALQSHLPTKDL